MYRVLLSGTMATVCIEGTSMYQQGVQSAGCLKSCLLHDRRMEAHGFIVCPGTTVSSKYFPVHIQGIDLSMRGSSVLYMMVIHCYFLFI